MGVTFSMNSEYKRGLAAEQFVLDVISRETVGFVAVKPSSKDDNITRDIDGWIKYIGDEGWIPVSIKSQLAAYTSGSMYLEVQVKKPVRDLGKGYCNDKRFIYRWYDSWARTGEAELYALDTGREVYLINKGEIAKHFSEVWVATIQGNRDETVQKQIAMGHPHHDARGVLVDIKAMVKLGFAQLLVEY